MHLVYRRVDYLGAVEDGETCLGKGSRYFVLGVVVEDTLLPSAVGSQTRVLGRAGYKAEVYHPLG